MANHTARPTVQYSLHARLGGGGIGHIAAQAVAGIHQAGHLARLFVSSNRQTAVPASLIRQWGWPGRGVKYLASREPLGLVDWLGNVLFDHWVAAQLRPGHIFHGWNAHCLHSLRRAKRLGLVTVVDRASSHPATQRRLLTDERARWNLHGAQPAWNDRRAVREMVEADFVLVPSAFARQSLIAEGLPAAKLIEIPFGVDLQRFRPPADRPTRPFRAMFVGQVALRKGVPDVLEAWRQLAWQDAELWVVGRQSAELHRLWPRWANLPGLRHLPHTPDIPALLQQADVFVFPSLEEGSALVTYEALAAGLPVITTSNAGSVVQDGVEGFLVPIRDPAALAARLEQLRRDPALRLAMGAAARQRAELFPWTAYGEKLVQAYRRITLGML